MSISKINQTNPSFRTTKTDKVSAPATQSKPLTSQTNTFAKGATTPAPTTPKRTGVTRDLSARKVTQPQAEAAAPTRSLPFTPNAEAVKRAETTGIGRNAASEVPKYTPMYNKASELTGVPSEMIAALHGNESQFGTYKKSTNGPESGFGLDPRWVTSKWGNEQLAKHGLGTWERGTGTDRSKLQSAVIAAEHFKRNAGYAGIKVGPNMSSADIAGAATAYIGGPKAGKNAKANGSSWMFNPKDNNPHPIHPGGTSVTGSGTVNVNAGRKEGLLRWDTMLPLVQKHMGGAQAPAAPTAQQGPAAPAAQQGPAAPAAAQGPAAPAAQAPARPTQGPQTAAPTGPTAAPQNTGLANTAAQHGLQTNQDLINHLYKQGGGSWDGAQQAARQMGVDLNDLVQNRGGAISTAQRPTLGGEIGRVAAQNGLQTNQDLINHFYKQGGGSWSGAQQAAQSMGMDLNQLVRNRQGSINPAGGTAPATGGTAPAGGTQAAPGGTAPGGTVPGGTAPAEGPTPATPPQGNTNGGSVLDVARNELALGVRENAGSNEDRAGHIRKYRNAVTAPGYRQNRGPEAWCADFVSYAFKNAGKPLGPQGKGFASVSMMKNWLRGENKFHTGQPQPGDIAFFKNFSHVAIVEKVNADGTVTTIEGNTSGTGGEGLHRKTRRMSGISGYGRP